MKLFHKMRYTLFHVEMDTSPNNGRVSRLHHYRRLTSYALISKSASIQQMLTVEVCGFFYVFDIRLQTIAETKAPLKQPIPAYCGLARFSISHSVFLFEDSLHLFCGARTHLLAHTHELII